LVVLTEFHPDRSEAVALDLREAGLRHRASAPAGYGYEVFIASRTPLQARQGTQATDALVGAYLEVVVPAHDVVVAGVYVPVISAVSLANKRRFWGMLHDAARRRLEEPYVLVGDLNTGDFPIDKETPGRPFSCTQEYRQMCELGMVEAWRAANGDRREYSWRSRQGTGFRLDHAFLSPGIRARLTGARYSHGEREAKISDHSILIVDLAPTAITTSAIHELEQEYCP
jgi:exonuclease III